MKHRPITRLEFTDPKLEEFRRESTRALDDLQNEANERAIVIIPAVTLPDATRVTVAHKLGRAPKWVGPSIPRGASAAGYINELKDAATDRTKLIVVQADGYGTTITMDLLVY